MGKSSRKKKERRKAHAARDQRLLGDLASKSLQPLLEAASVSPTADARMPSIAILFESMARRSEHGKAKATAADLGGLIAAAEAAHPEIWHQQDFLPHDGRALVYVRWGDDLFRSVAGSLERPIATVRQQHLIASVIDPVLVPRFGFGLLDAGDLILRRMDHVAQTLAPAWPMEIERAVGDAPRVSAEEVDLAGYLSTLPELASQALRPEAAAAALSRFAPRRKSLRIDPHDSVSTFGTSIGFRVGSGYVPTPAGFLPEVLSAVGRELSAEALALRPEIEAQYSGEVGNRIGRLFRGLGIEIAGPVRVGVGRPIHSVVFFNDRQILALDVAAGFSTATTQSRLDSGSEALARFQPGFEVRTPGPSLTLPADAEIVRLQIIAGPHHGVPVGLRGPAIRLEDLEWILESCQEDAIDLWYFVRDLEGPRGIQQSFAWDMIDRWEVWKSEKSFYRGGVDLTTMMFEPHASVAEWDEAARRASSERALHTLKLPELCLWPIVSLHEEGGFEVGDIARDVAFEVLPWAIPVAVAKNDPTGPDDQAEMIWTLAVAIAWRLDQIQSAFLQASRNAGITSLQVRLFFDLSLNDEPLRFGEFDGRVLTIGWGSALADGLQHDSSAVEKCCGEIVSTLFEADGRAVFSAAWNDAPPSIRMDPYSVRQNVQRLPRPIKSHGSHRSGVLREFAEHLAASDVQPGDLSGSDAMTFESTVAFPWLLDRFHASIAHCSSESVLKFALDQSECVHYLRFMLDKRLAWERGFPVRRNSGVQEERSSLTGTTRVVSFIVEECLARPPLGSAEVDHAGWVEALSVAELCIESCFRSDAIHRRLRAAVVRVSELYEVDVEYSNGPTDVDIDAYNSARSAATMPAAVAIGDREVVGGDVESEGLSFTERQPEFAPVDVAMRSELGFGIDAMFGVLNFGAQMETDALVSRTRTTVDEFVAECEGLIVGGSSAEYRAAVDWMTLRSEDLAGEAIPHWETERRRSRLLTRPFVAEGEALWVLPWTIESAQRVVLAYLTDGRLPWPRSVLPDSLGKVLDRFRQSRNDELEQDCFKVLDSREYVVHLNIKPEKADHYGIIGLSGEIDVLCIDELRSRIWVVEAKDPYNPHSARQIRQLVDQFERSGKYVDRLLAKVDDVARCAVSVGHKFDVQQPDRRWQVCGLMATRQVLPSAFATPRRVPYCVVDELLHIVEQDEIEDLAVRIVG